MVPITEGLTVSATTLSTTSISVSWELQNTLTATGYTISYTNTNNTQCFTDSRSSISASGTSHTVDNLEEGTQYSITVTATLTGGGTLGGSATAPTLTASEFSVSSFLGYCLNSLSHTNSLSCVCTHTPNLTLSQLPQRLLLM